MLWVFLLLSEPSSPKAMVSVPVLMLFDAIYRRSWSLARASLIDLDNR
jgi:hypothetical protein